MVRLNRLAVEGLFSYAKMEVEFSERIVIVGPNNAGKSSLFRIINLLVDALLNGSKLPASKTFQSNDNPRIEAEISPSPDEADALVSFLRGRTSEAGPESGAISKRSKEELIRRMDPVTIRVEWKTAPGGSGGDPEVEALFPACGFGLRGKPDGRSLKAVPMGGTERRPPSDTVPFEAFLNAVLESGDPKRESGLFLRSKNVIHQPIELGTLKTDGQSVEIRDLMLDIRGRKGPVNLFWFLGTILHSRIVHAAENKNLLQGDAAEALERLALCPDRPGESARKYNRTLLDRFNANSVQSAVRLKHDGSNLAQFLFTLKNSPNSLDAERYATIKGRFERIFKDQSLTIEPIEEHRDVDMPMDKSGQLVDRRLTIVCGTTRRLPLEQVGTGARGVIHLLTAVYGAEDSIVMLDEPGANLHPTMLREVMGVKTKKPNNQILTITHSPDLLRQEMARPDTRIVRVVNTDGQSRIYPKAGQTGAEPRDPRGIAHTVGAAVFFAKLAVVVEGKSDRAVLGLADRMAVKEPKYNLPLNNIAVVGVGGKYGFARCRSLLDKYGIPWIILADGDAKDMFDPKEVSWISKDGVGGDGPVFLLKGDLEKFMEETDSDTFEEFRHRRKVVRALEWAELTLEKNPDGARLPMAEFLDRCLSAASRG